MKTDWKDGTGEIPLPFHDLRSLTWEEILALMEAWEEKSFRAGQIYGWLHKKRVRSLDEIGNVPRKLLDRLAAFAPLYGVTEEERYRSKEDGTEKFLFSLHDGQVIESVLMRYHYGNCVCISSQAGCRMGCRFCASTLDGLARNLSPAEMLDQIYAISRITGEKISHVVVMGTGEPFDNYDALCRMIEILSDPEGTGLSRRNLTVSTCGIVPRMRDFADRFPQVTLAVSLHASADEERRQLMPIARQYSLDRLMDASRYYIQKTGRRITFEYSLVKGINDGKEQAERLSRLLQGMNCHVNLIPVNPVQERPYRQSDNRSLERFRQILQNHHIQVTVRRELGRDIQAACGQLRKKYRERGGEKCSPME